MRKTLVLAGLVILLAAGCSSGSSNNDQQSNHGSTSGSQSIAETTTYTMDQVKEANSEQKCWTAINGKVYDVTSFINRHPGGKQNILKLCGTDGTAAFTAQHGSDRRPNQELAGLEIGLLK